VPFLFPPVAPATTTVAKCLLRERETIAQAFPPSLSPAQQ